MDEIDHMNKLETSEDVEDSVFKKMSIPRTLGNITIEKVEKDLFGEDKMPIYHKVVTGIDKKDIIKEQK